NCPPLFFLRSGRRTMRALLVEADSSNRIGLRAALEDRGWQPTIASCSTVALELFRAEAFALVVLPAVLEPHGAAALAGQLRALPRGDEACILVAHEGPLTGVDALVSSGVDDVVDLSAGSETAAHRLAFALGRARR